MLRRESEDLLVRDVVGEQAELGGEHAEGEGGGEDEDDAVGEEGDGEHAGEAGGRHGGLAHVVAGLGVEAAGGLQAIAEAGVGVGGDRAGVRRRHGGSLAMAGWR